MQQSSRALGAAALMSVKKEATKFLSSGMGYSAGIMKTVEFEPEKITERKDGALSFQLVVRRGALNSFKSAHGGALSSLADAFTRVHLGSVASAARLLSVSFEISFISAITEDKECVCLTRLVNMDTNNMAFMDFSFEDAKSREVFARGTHVLSRKE